MGIEDSSYFTAATRTQPILRAAVRAVNGEVVYISVYPFERTSNLRGIPSWFEQPSFDDVMLNITSMSTLLDRSSA